MLLVVHGTDFKKARAKIASLLNGLEKKRPDAEQFILDDERFDAITFEELLGGQGLFERKYIVLLDSIFSSKEAKERIMEAAKRMEISENVFILYESSLLKKDLSKLSKHAYEVYEFSEVAKKGAEYKPFGLTDAVGKRSVKDGWNELQRAWMEGKSPEEIHGLLFWQVKSMIIAASCNSAAEAGMKPFVFGKAKKGAANYKEEELYALSNGLVERYHRARRGGGDLAIHLEEFILSLKK